MKLTLREILTKYTEDLMQYTREAHSILGHDDREPEEFVDIFLKSREINGLELVSLNQSEIPMKSVKSYNFLAGDGAESLEELNQ